jgi:hypothetical protein
VDLEVCDTPMSDKDLTELADILTNLHLHEPEGGVRKLGEGSRGQVFLAGLDGHNVVSGSFYSWS